MSRQDKATTERHSRTLRELIKRPENKLCADCKRNDPRWASWNLGVFLCIRCSGIHRGMGTHISKVKSVDLDVWTPEQMNSIQKWGNHLANLYWEAHLKAGHVPPEHKMESFIRSKYESRRWAMEGPPPSDPSILENGTAAPTPVAAEPPQQLPPPRATHTPTSSVSFRQNVSPTSTRHQLLSANLLNRPLGVVPAPSNRPSPPTEQPKPPTSQTPQNDLFSLDFHAPASITPSGSSSPPPDAQAPKKDVKQDILSLFSTPASQPASTMAPGFGQFGAPAQTSPWGTAPSQSAAAAPPATSMMGANGTGMWGASSGWNGAPSVPAQPNVWGAPAITQQPQQQPNLFANSNDIWGNSAAPVAVSAGNQDLFGSFSTPAPAAQKKDDVFGDLWGGFK